VAAAVTQQPAAQALEPQDKDSQEELVIIIFTVVHILPLEAVEQAGQVLTEQPLRVVVVELV
jgi:hypothetical protein